MNSFALKLIAIVTMLIDHMAVVLIPSDTILYIVMRGIGRLAFPLFVFLLVEGFFHTHDVKKYLIRLGAFALISEIPYDMSINHTIFETSQQNVFFTLFLGLLLITLLNKVERNYFNQAIKKFVLTVVLILGIGTIAILLKTDYSYAGILLAVAFYQSRGNKLMLAAWLLMVSGFLLGGINILATLAIIPISLYNGEKGKNVKYIFYIFYPAHLLILGLVNMLR